MTELQAMLAHSTAHPSAALLLLLQSPQGQHHPALTEVAEQAQVRSVVCVAH